MDSLEIATAIAATVGLAIIMWVYKNFFGGPPRLKPNKYIPVKLIRKETVSSNAERPTVFLTFDANVSEFPTGAHVSCKFESNGKQVIRPYTPTRFSESECELMVRVYPKGQMTQHMHKLKVGDTLLFRGPTGMKRYGRAGPGTFSKVLKSKETHQRGLTDIIMLAGGTGITPMLQICNHIIRDDTDSTRVQLLVANSSPSDVMLYDELVKLERASKKQIRVHFTVSRCGDDWKHIKGRVTKEMVKNLCPPPSKKVACAICGPPGFNKVALSILDELGHAKEMIWQW
eukprot:CAMPEP_0114500170 /NCGR_PEP_ID=MMETSP0109-20121206/7814_1 /TAXON_ID=29199 /ORGANISM="Chlorarachnion reptans, Strain CCCM449" /LENGTH=286 /DNA_ID=CAMNT_0001677799 /DNA_START=125 /DNA_END=985 /DNA_ORIENTATION=+